MIFEDPYEDEVIPNPRIKFAFLGEDGNVYSPGNKNGQGLYCMDHVLHPLIVLRERRHGKDGGLVD